MGAGEGGKETRWPAWLHPLLRTAFFVRCELHGGSHRNECNMYCLDCAGGALCPTCVALHHRQHRAIQIRRSSYHDVIRVAEIQRHLDVAGVQTYVINGARVVFLNERRQPRPGKGVANICRSCGRGLLGPFDFCSLGCKLARTTSGDTDVHRKLAASPPPNSYLQDHELIRIECIAPGTPPPTAINERVAKRRKGTPRRAPMGV
ncbi:hypothetical protein Taro_023115 [Colocasia esculenta]|uniref:PLATZ transcription factor family protein n=1 Tax=Colocasia esculenta TaxID=4460 RepID=A0A843V9X4_COLES|nr:hypothetical protein [Colocasia esculenta]